MKIVYGHTAITCRLCGTVTAIDNEALEALTVHKCPRCGQKMTDREIARLKMHLYLLWSKIYDEHCGPMVELFDYEINLMPHITEDVEKMEENGNREGGYPSVNEYPTS